MNSSTAEVQVTKEYELYLRFKDERPCWPFIGLSLTFGILATVGIVLNTLHIYVTIKTKSLHGTSFILLALVSAFESVHLSGQYLFPFVALSGQNFIDFALAAKICAPSFFANQYTSLIMLSIGIDRLICIMTNRQGTHKDKGPTGKGPTDKGPTCKPPTDKGPTMTKDPHANHPQTKDPRTNDPKTKDPRTKDPQSRDPQRQRTIGIRATDKGPTHKGPTKTKDP
ncbi:hypothetical protein niasHT_038527 [Heterodera trifolii]|uniref:G-protein coupled receptors family 1 profile domain-containing protein n=1 Tax=Heterodera trifolii TaxID=157864 RepID=A0ABD2I035_9BILA